MRAVSLGQALLASMKHVEAVLLFVFEHTASSPRPNPFENESASQLRHRLEQARDAAREEFADLFLGMNGDAGDGPKSDDIGHAEEASDQFLFVVSLIEVSLHIPKFPRDESNSVFQMANEMRQALLVADNILDLHNTSRTLLWYPRLSWAWLGIAPPTIIGDDRDRVMSDDHNPECFEDENRLSMAEAREGLSELVSWRESNLSNPIPPFPSTKFPMASRESLRLRNIIYGPRITRLRLLFASCVRAVTHSSHLQHAVKNSIGVMLLSLPAFLSRGSPGGIRVFWV
jgi:hypothetical protein